MLYFKLTQNPYKQELIVLDTTVANKRTMAQGTALWSPRLSPDGRAVAFTSVQDQNPEKAKWELLVQAFAATGPRVLLQGERKTPQDGLTPLVPVSWSTNGLLVEKIIWASDATPQGLYLVDPDTGALKPVYEKPYVHAVPSPDGKQAILVQGQIGMGEVNPKLSLSLLDIASGQVKTVVPETSITFTSLHWSPDSKKFLYTIQPSTTGPATEVRVMNADGSNMQKLPLDVQWPLRDVTWRDNGTLLLLFVDPQNTLHVSKVTLDNLQLQAAAQIGQIAGSDPQNLGDQFIYVPQQ